jgi:hypothetical protein
VNTLYCLEKWRGEQRIGIFDGHLVYLWVIFMYTFYRFGILYQEKSGDNFTPGGQLRPWGSKLAPRGEVENEPLDAPKMYYEERKTSSTTLTTICSIEI